MNKVYEQIVYAYNNSPFYKEKLKGFESFISSDFSVVNYKQLPFTTKSDLSENNEDFLAVSRSDISEYVTTSGTSGSPVSIYLTDSDIVRLEKNEFDSLSLMGGKQEDVYQLMTTIDKQFMAGLAYSLGVRKLKAGMIRIGPGVPQMQFDSILKYKPSILIAVPSFIVTLIEFAKIQNIDLNSLSVKSIICIGEAIRNVDFSLNSLGEKILQDWNVELFSTYASTEMGAAFSECCIHKGNHLNEDLLFIEVLNENNQDVASGEVGELVFTTIGVEGTPLIRYRSGDLVQLFSEPCECGKASPRISSILGRKNQMIKFKGTTIFPKSIFDILENHQLITLFKINIQKDILGNDDVFVLLPKELENEQFLIDLKHIFKSKIKIIPKFVFKEYLEIYNSVYQSDKRKPIKFEVL